MPTPDMPSRVIFLRSQARKLSTVKCTMAPKERLIRVMHYETTPLDDETGASFDPILTRICGITRNPKHGENSTDAVRRLTTPYAFSI